MSPRLKNALLVLGVLFAVACCAWALMHAGIQS